MENEKYAFRCFLLRIGFIGDFINDSPVRDCTEAVLTTLNKEMQRNPKAKYSESRDGDRKDFDIIGVTMNIYTHLELEDVKDEMIRMEELNADKKELKKTTGEKTVTQKMFRAI